VSQERRYRSPLSLEQMLPQDEALRVGAGKNQAADVTTRTHLAEYQYPFAAGRDADFSIESKVLHAGAATRGQT
jgi:hypothetical protein